jgi:hypothetical protein
MSNCCLTPNKQYFSYIMVRTRTYGWRDDILCTRPTRLNGRRDRDRMVVGFITTYAISAYHHWRCEFESRSGEVYSIQHYVIKFFSGFLRVVRFPPPIKLTVCITKRFWLAGDDDYLRGATSINHQVALRANYQNGKWHLCLHFVDKMCSV